MRRVDMVAMLGLCACGWIYGDVCNELDAVMPMQCQSDDEDEGQEEDGGRVGREEGCRVKTRF